MEISTKRIKGVLSLIGVLFLLAPLTVFAANKVVVIPLFGPDAKPLKNIITVAKANGNFTDPVAALNSITDASATNPYLVVIGPGVYTITSTLVMKPYVDIAGSGENVTKITGAISAGNHAHSTIISGANNSVLSFLTVENTGGSTYSIALYNNSASPRLADITATASGGDTTNVGVSNYNSSPTMTNVTATGSGGTTSRGVYNIDTSSPVMTNVTATGSGGTSYNYGVYNQSSSPVMTDVTATGSGGTGYNYGVYNYSSSPVMTNVTATGSGGTSNRGVYNEGSSPVMTHVTATGSGGTNNRGVYNTDESNPKIRHTTMDGGTDGLYASSTSTSTVSQSTIIGGVGGTGTKTCVACDNGSGTALNGSCQ